MQNTNIDNKDLADDPADLELASEAPGTQEHAVRTTEGGRRAARTASIVAEIDDGFSDQRFSTRALASKLGLSVRYVQDLAKDSGFSITERILALRLQKAHAILMNDRSCMRKISDVASTCGFNEVSHFHRAFAAALASPRHSFGPSRRRNKRC